MLVSPANIDLVAMGLSNRPELAASRSLVCEAVNRLRREGNAPWLPSVLLGTSYGSFGAGTGSQITKNKCRVRYAVNTEVGNSGSPIMDQDFNPIALHHSGSEGKPAWDTKNAWPGGFNQGIPLSLIVNEIRKQVSESVRGELGL